MKHKIVAIMLLVLTLLPSNLSAGPLERMVERLIPQARQQILFVQEISPSKRNYFEISESSGKIRIRGNSPVNMACGLNWYLKHYGQPVITWKGKQIQLTGKLPMPQNLIRKETPLPHSFYLDQRAFGYTTAFWDWTDWEAEIDRMALNGITMPLALVGTECVWINTLKHLETGEISDSLGRGRHTTRAVSLYDVHGGKIADTPGFSSLDYEVDNAEDLSEAFPEIRQASHGCKFRSCTHTHEPSCAVKEEVENGQIWQVRYDNYLQFLSEIENRRETYKKTVKRK